MNLPPALACFCQICPHSLGIIVVVCQQPTQMFEHFHLLKLVPLCCNQLCKGDPSGLSSITLHLPITPILAELGVLVPPVEGSVLHLHSTSLKFWEGDCSFAQDHYYKIQWVVIMKVPSKTPLCACVAGAVWYRVWCTPTWIKNS